MDDINNSVEMSLSKRWEMKDKKAWRAAIDGVAESDRQGVLRKGI